MAHRSLRTWLRRPGRPQGRPPSPTRPRCQPRLLRLEDRVAPAVTQFDYGGLRFIASDGFQEDINRDLYARAGTVSIGYVPSAAGESFLPLVRADLTGSQANFPLQLFNATEPTQPRFEIDDAELNMVVVSGTPSVPIPIVRTDFVAVSFDIARLTGLLGMNLSQSVVKPFEVGKVDFGLTALYFANPNGGDTSDAQVKFQGEVSFDKVPLLDDADVRAEVTGDNYVIAGRTGITITGATVTRTFTFDGIEVAGSITVGYDRPTTTYTFGGTVTVTSTAQGVGESSAFQDVSAGLTLSVGDGQLKSVGFSISASFKIFELTVKPYLEPFKLQYQLPTPTDPNKYFAFSGGAQVELNDGTVGNTVTVDFGDAAQPGVVVTGGKLARLNATVTADFELSRLMVFSDGLTFEYDAANDQFEMYGNLRLSVRGSSQVIQADLGTAADPGLVVVDRQVQSVHMGLSGSFDVFGLNLNVGANGNPAAIDWRRSDRSYLVSGTFTADFEVFQTSLALGTETQPGLSIIDGTFKVDSVTFTLVDAVLGPVTLNELRVAYTADGDSFDLGVTVKVAFPGGWRVCGMFDFVMGRLDTISVDGTFPPEAVQIPATGLSIVDIHVKVTNLDNPANIVVDGGLAVVWGEKVPMLGPEVYLFRATGDVTVDANELVIEATAQLGAYTPDNGATWQGVLGEGDAKLTLDWQDNFYSLHVAVDGLFRIFDIEGDLVFSAGRDIALLAEAAVVVPPEVPFIGGDKIEGAGFFFQHIFPHDNVPTSTTFAAWIDLDIIWTFTVGFEVVIDAAGDSHFSLIGGGTVAQFEQAVRPPTNQTYTFTADFTNTLPAGTTSLVVGVDWSKPVAGVDIVGGRPKFSVEKVQNGRRTVITESQFAANGISFISDARFNGPTKAAIHIVGSRADQYAPIAAQYTLLMAFTTQGGNPFPDYPNAGAGDALAVQAAYHIPKPSFGPLGGTTPYAPPLPTTRPTGTFPVTVQGNIDEAFFDRAKVSLYRVMVADPRQRPVLVGTMPLTQIAGNGVNWRATFNVPIEGLFPVPYVLYAVLNDNYNPPPTDRTDKYHQPVQSASSVPFTPDFAVQGAVRNQNLDPQGGWTVFLDYNLNGVRDANEPGTQTNRAGFYSFTRKFASPSLSPVPVNAPFNVVLVPLAPKNFDPVATPTVTFDGTTPVNRPFALKEHSAIQGTVFVDQNNTSAAADSTGVPGAVVYLDLNHNGRRDPNEPTALTNATGRYDFANRAAGTYAVVLDPTSLSNTTPRPAYVVPAGTVGNRTNAYTYGASFAVAKPVQLTSLGVFDSGGDGLTQPLTVILYDRATRAILAQMTFTPSAPGTLVGGSRFKSLAQPVTLLPGFQGVIAAFGFGPADPAGGASSSAPRWTTDGGNGRLTFGRGVYATTAGTFPTNTDGSPYPNPYAAGSFLFREPAWAQTGPTPRTVTVTVGAGGYDLYEGNDFGTLPPAYVAGSITGHALDGNGNLRSTALPAVHGTAPLYVAVNAGGSAAGGGYQADRDFSGGQTFSTTNAIDTSAVNDPAPQAVYQTYRGTFGTQFSYALSGLTPGAAYAVRLHFAETAYSSAGQRQFNVSINGQQVMMNFDIVAAAGNRANAAVVSQFAAAAGANGVITVVFARGARDNPIVSAIQVIQKAAVAINAGGGAVTGGQTFRADGDFTDGQTFSSTNPIDTSAVTDPAPASLYQTYRGTFGAQFSYALAGLTPGAAYAVRLHFAETAVTAAGQRRFNVAINGRQVMTDFDVFASAGGMNTAVVEAFATFADATGAINIVFSRGIRGGDNPIVSGIEVITTNTPLAGWAVQLLADVPVARIDAGGGGRGNYTADADFNGGAPSATTAAIDTSQVLNPAPDSVYQSGRAATAGAFNYAIPGLTPNAPYLVRLHFAETAWGRPGQRRFNVAINARQVLIDFDIFAAAGGANVAIAEAFNAFADGTGTITVAFTNGSAGAASVNAIELLRPGAVVDTATTDVDGNYVFQTYTPGRYTVQEVPPAGWRQLSPFHADPTFAETTVPLGPSASRDSALATADFNGDGYLDVALSPQPGAGSVNPVYAFFNRKDGTFGPAVEIDYGAAAGSGGSGIAAADINGDGRPDLVLMNYGSAQPVLVFLNTGSGNPNQQFQYVPNYWHLASYAGGLVKGPAVGDFNGDGRDDVLVQYNFGSPSGPVAGALLLLNAAQPGGRTVTNYPLPINDRLTGPGDMAVGDLNGDGRSDVFTSGGPDDPAFSQVSFALGDGRGNLAPWTTYYVADGVSGGGAALGDIRGMGSLDVSLAGFLVGDYVLQQLYNGGGAVFDVPPRLSDQTSRPLNPLPSRMRLADVNGDRKPDLLLLLARTAGGAGTDGFLVYLNTGTTPYFQTADPLFFPLPNGSSTSFAGDVTVADLNNDGLLDVFVSALDSQTGFIYLNTTPQKQPGIPVFLPAGGLIARDAFVNVQTPQGSSVYGQVFEDANRNGRQDAGESGEAGWFVFVDRNRNRRFDAGEPSAVTRALGAYAIAGLAADRYSVGVVPADDWRTSTPAEFVEVAVDAATAAQADFGRVRRLLRAPAVAPVPAGRTASLAFGLTAAASGRRLAFSLAPGAPAGAAVDPVTGAFTWTPPRRTAAGTYHVTVQVRDPLEPTFADAVTVDIPIVAAPAVGLLAVGADAGGGPVVRVYNGDGTLRFTLQAYDPAFRGGVRVATGDVTGDSVPDVIAAAGLGGGPHVKVFDGATGATVASFMAYGEAFRGGVYVAAGDVDGDGRADVITGPGFGGGPHVRVFSGAGSAVLREFLAYDPAFTGGVLVAAGDVDGDGKADVITGAGRGGGPHVKTFGGTSGAVLRSFLAYDLAFRGGVSVAAGDVDGDGRADLVTGPGVGGGPQVKVFGGASGALVREWMAYDPAFRGGIRVAAGDVDGDVRADVVTGAGPGGGPHVKAFAGATGQAVRSFLAFDPAFLGGVFVGPAA